MHHVKTVQLMRVFDDREAHEQPAFFVVHSDHSA
jgi:hypothetical protein